MKKKLSILLSGLLLFFSLFSYSPAAYPEVLSCDFMFEVTDWYELDIDVVLRLARGKLDSFLLKEKGNFSASPLALKSLSEQAQRFTISAEKDYFFSLTIQKDNETTNYDGFLRAVLSDDAAPQIHIITMEKSKQESFDFSFGLLPANVFYEQEPNDTISQANSIADGNDNYGRIYTANDVDWYRVVFTQNGDANFWLGEIPNGCDYDLTVCNQSGEELATSTNSGSANELISLSVESGIPYYLKVFSTSVPGQLNYHLRAKNYPTNNVIWPAPGLFRLSQEFNPKSHLGIDIAPRQVGVPNDSIVCIADGKVIRNEFSKTYGNVVYINTPTIGGFPWVQHRYAHLHKKSPLAYGTVRQGDFVGPMGTTGNSSGVHLHFETRSSNTEPNTSNSSHPFDPIPVFYSDLGISTSLLFNDGQDCCHIRELCLLGNDGLYYSIDQLRTMTEEELLTIGITPEMLREAEDNFRLEQSE